MRIKNILIGVGIVGICLAGFYGCNETSQDLTVTNQVEPTSPGGSSSNPGESYSISTAIGRVEILSIEPSPSDLLVKLHIRVVPENGPSYNRTVATQLASETPGSTSFAGSVTDDEGLLLYRLEFAAVNSESHQFRITVADQSEQVVVEHWESDSVVFENYEINGRLHSFSIDKSSMEYGRELYQSGLVGGRFDRRALPQRSPSDKALISSIECIQDLFGSSRLLSQKSEAAELMAHLLANPKVQQTIKENLGEPGDQIVINKMWKKICAAAGICTYFACEFFPPNVVCATCGVVALGCAIAELFSSLF